MSVSHHVGQLCMQGALCRSSLSSVVIAIVEPFVRARSLDTCSSSHGAYLTRAFHGALADSFHELMFSKTSWTTGSQFPTSVTAEHIEFSQHEENQWPQTASRCEARPEVSVLKSRCPLRSKTPWLHILHLFVLTVVCHQAYLLQLSPLSHVRAIMVTAEPSYITSAGLSHAVAQKPLYLHVMAPEFVLSHIFI